MTKLALCVSVVLVLLMALNNSFARVPCCTEYYESKIGFQHLKNYTEQNITDTCNIKAVIFQLQKGKFFCTNPEERWVKKAIAFLDKKLSRASSH